MLGKARRLEGIDQGQGVLEKLNSGCKAWDPGPAYLLRLPWWEVGTYR